MKSARTANITAVLLIAGWCAAGLYFRSHQQPLAWLPKTSLTIAVLSPLAWILLYTSQGLFGHGKWWRTDVGTNMVWLETTVVWTSGMILWSQWFNHGLLNTFAQAWAYIGGVLAGAVVINWRSVIWLRNYRRDPGAELRELRAENAALRARLGES